jgi:hypothetical protein
LEVLFIYPINTQGIHKPFAVSSQRLAAIDILLVDVLPKACLHITQVTAQDAVLLPLSNDSS